MRARERGETKLGPASLLALGLVCALLACTTPTGTRSTSELLPRPGGRVELREVRNASGRSFEVDATALLREAMARALAEEGLVWTPGSPGDRFVLTLAIREYRPGNAFQRWLAPGFGSTVLRVDGELRDAATGALAATVEHARSVHWGGAYTIGAWEHVFGWVADDLAADLRVRIEQGGEFVVAVTPRADDAPATEPAADARSVRLASLTDARSEKGRIGERQAAFGVSMGDVHLARRVPELMREVLLDELWASGARVVETGGDVAIDATLRRFWLHTDTTPLYWDVVGEIELDLAVTKAGAAPTRRSLACRRVERTWVYPTATLSGRVLDACLAELGAKLRAELES